MWVDFGLLGTLLSFCLAFHLHLQLGLEANRSLRRILQYSSGGMMVA